jgi:hypothetical protein
MNIQLYRCFLYFLITGVLIACGGGGGGSGSGTTALEGVFVDSTVEGIRFQTPTHEGTTDSNGTFTYEPGEQIQFYIGDILLGEVAGKAQITPIDLVPDRRISRAEVLFGAGTIISSTDWHSARDYTP